MADQEKTTYLESARVSFKHGHYDRAQAAALIAIAEALQPRTTEIKIEGKTRKLNLIEDFEATRKERDDLREVVQGADHTAAKYWRRMVGAEADAKRALVLMDKAIEEKEAAELRARNVVASLRNNHDGKTPEEELLRLAEPFIAAHELVVGTVELDEEISVVPVGELREWLTSLAEEANRNADDE